MANQKIFCNVPWHQTHLYWDGSYGACCNEFQKLPNQDANISNTSIIQWHNSGSMQQFRERILGDEPLPECSLCYQDEAQGVQSKRIKENYKDAIFTEQAFGESFKQSPWHDKFTPQTDRLPVDWHVDFGNECNLACKMCHPGASSKIADRYTKWKIPYDKKPNWVNDSNSWNQLLENIKSVEDLHRIHIMGGEPTVNKKFYKFIDWLIDNKLTHVSLSFVSNGTRLDKSLIDDLKKFRHTDIEISVEAIGETNDYVRQGGNTTQIWENVNFAAKSQTDNLSVVLRSVPQLLTINTYHEYILRAKELNLSIQSLPCFWPSYLSVNILPHDIRDSFKENYVNVKNSLSIDGPVNTIAVGRDTSRLDQQLVRECDVMLSLLDSPSPDNVEQQRHTLIEWMMRWDKQFNFDARIFYPEYKHFFESYGYSV